MKKVILLLIVLAALIGVAIVTKDNSENRLKPAAAREKLLPDLDVNAVRKVRIREYDTTKGAFNTVTLAITGDQWGVGERSGYPAAFEKLGKMLMDLKEQKAGKQKKYGPGAWADLKLKEPKDGVKDEGAGLSVELLGDSDKVIRTLVLGKNVTSSTVGRDASPFGGGGNERYARVNDDGDTVWQVDGQFYDIRPAPEDWVDKSFIEVTKIKEIEVTPATAADGWKASRKDESGEFALADAKPGEDFDKDKASLTSVLSNPTFNDVVPKDKATADFMKDATKAKITTFDGFTYNVQFIKKGSGSDEKHYISVSTTGDFPKERPAVKDEKPEDKKKADDEFAAKKKTLEEKLAKEKKAEGWIFEISSYTLGGLEKKRSEILKEKPAEPAKAGGAPPAPPATTPSVPTAPPAPPAPPKTPITVTTPPVSVPASPAPAAPAPPKPELKAPPKDPLPVTPAPTKPAEAPKPATPAPAAAPAPAKPAEAPKPADPAPAPAKPDEPKK